MKRFKWIIGLGVCFLMAGFPSWAEKPTNLKETQILEKKVGKNDLPPIGERIPETPLIVSFETPGRVPGKQGNTLHTLLAKEKDIRMISVYSYSRLVGYNTKFEIVPDILESFDNKDNKEFVLHLRPGHKWSDGSPFTAEDFRYFWEDVANNPDLTPSGVPIELLVNGEKPEFQIIDQQTIVYRWNQPNPAFVRALASPTPLYIYRPAAYLKKFHQKYADPAELSKMVQNAQVRQWAELHNKMDEMGRATNPELPTLDPWMNTTGLPAQQFIFERNPFYHKVDIHGLQLPYIDKIIVDIASSKAITAKTASGESDLQARGLSFSDIALLKNEHQRYNYVVDLWTQGRGNQVTLYPNLNVKDPILKQVFRDVRFRRALSLAINRTDIKNTIYLGMGNEAANTVLPISPLFKESWATAWTQFDTAAANQLLDEMGLNPSQEDNIRRLPDGRPLELVIETAGEEMDHVDVLELIREDWKKIGIQLSVKTSPREILRNRIFSGEAMMMVWYGLDNGIPNPDMSPEEISPRRQVNYQWPLWGQYAETKGKLGEAPDLPEAQTLLKLYEDWQQSTSTDQRKEIWNQMLDIWADQVFTIGIVSGIPQPVVAHGKLRNVPTEGVFNWDPGAHFGIYQPDTFWFDF